VTTLTPHTTKHVGFVAANGSFHTIIPRYTPLPVRRTIEFANSIDSQKEVYLAVWEASHTIETETLPVEKSSEANESPEPEPETVQRVVIKPETLLAELVLSGLPEKKVGEVKLEATITIDANLKTTMVLREKNGKAVVKAEMASSA